ncbi:MAG TPA: dephospho-CoA kinase [Gaiellaceae bacterium]|nr:dephospho-CoA kinase [Gaiellaceae bacterium]
MRPRAVAITGGIAAGKSEALAAFARHGAATLSADDLVHELLATDDDVREAIRTRWGEDAVGDRARIGEIVFRDPAELEWLEQLLHPKTRASSDAWLAAVDRPIAVVEVPLLYETGGEARFDAVVVITAPPEVRGQRRSGLTERETRLIPDEEKLKRADYAFVNDGSLDALDEFVGGVMERLSSSS